MWHKQNLRAKILAVTVGAVLPVIVATTALTVRLSRSAVEDDLRRSGLALARELAASVAARQGFSNGAVLQKEIDSILGRGSLVRDVAVLEALPQGVVVRASGGGFQAPRPDDEVSAREGQEVVTLQREGSGRVLRIAAPIWADERSIGAVSLTLPLVRADALATTVERQAVILGVVTMVLLISTVAIFMSRALAAPLGRILQVMGRAEGGDLNARAPEDRQDEVGQVARGLNRMLDRVSSFNAELAHRVAEATAELRATNQRLYTAQQQVTRNERLAAAGELAATMAHAVGTPLTGISGHLQLLEEEVTDETIKGRLHKIQAQIDRTVEAARRFLDAARPVPSRVPVNLPSLLADLLVLTSPESQRKGIIVESAVTADLPTVSGDQSQLQELFLNLIANALDAMGNGGTLGVATEVSPAEDGGATVRVTVHDTGAGIAPEVLERVFDPFFTTRASTGGTGLGLAIARRIARDHGGSIRLESEPGRGTRVTVELPTKTD